MNMVSSAKERNKVLCSTPEHDSPSRDSDSLCDSDTASPVPFFCTQDGAEGETDVVWNYYTPKTEQIAKSRIKNSTPLSRKGKKPVKKTITEKPIPKRRTLRSTQKKTELFQDLIELNQNLHKFITKNDKDSEKGKSGSEEDIFSNSPDCSPKSGLRSNSRCLRKNLLSSKFSKPETETALESDDSMNECLIKASQIVEENILQPEKKCKTTYYNYQDSIDNMLGDIHMDSLLKTPMRTKTESPKLNNDSFDMFVGNLNESVLERLTQMPIKEVTPVRKRTPKPASSGWVLKEFEMHEGSPSRNIFARHSSMPESPTIGALNKPSTSGMIFGRYNSMPPKNEENGDSPIKCTPEEIRHKHLQAREKLLAKRLLPFTSTQNSSQQIKAVDKTEASAPKKVCFQPKVPSYLNSKSGIKNVSSSREPINNQDLKKIIEKKRQEALMKLKKKQIR